MNISWREVVLISWRQLLLYLSHCCSCSIIHGASSCTVITSFDSRSALNLEANESWSESRRKITNSRLHASFLYLDSDEYKSLSYDVTLHTLELYMWGKLNFRTKWIIGFQFDVSLTNHNCKFKIHNSCSYSSYFSYA